MLPPPRLLNRASTARAIRYAYATMTRARNAAAYAINVNGGGERKIRGTPLVRRSAESSEHLPRHTEMPGEKEIYKAGARCCASAPRRARQSAAYATRRRYTRASARCCARALMHATYAMRSRQRDALRAPARCCAASSIRRYRL